MAPARDGKPKAWFSWLTRLERHELGWLLVALGACVLLLVFLKLASEVMEGETLAFDKRIVLAFRKADDPSRPIGPAWMASAMIDLTALGGPTVISLVVLGIVGFLVLQARYWTAFFVFLTAASGEVISYVLRPFSSVPVLTPSCTCAKRSRPVSRAGTRCSRRSSISRSARC